VLNLSKEKPTVNLMPRTGQLHSAQ